MDRGDLLNFVKAAVEDEQKIVTYKWLSLIKNVPMNCAKMALQEFVKVERRSGLNVYLCVIGYKNCGEQKTISVTIIKEEEKERALMDFAGATSHVYGVQRTNSDASLLYSCDYDISKKLSMDNKNLLGICCDHVIVKSRKKVVEMVSTIVSQQNVTEKKPIPSLGNPKKSTVESFFSKQKLPKSQSNNSDDTDSGFNELKCSSETTKSVAASHFKNHSKTKDSRDANFGNGDTIAEPEQARVQASNKSTKSSVKKNSTSRKSQLVQKGKRKRVLESSESDGNDSFEELDQSMDMFESTSPRMQSFSKPTSDEKSQNSSGMLSTHCSNQDTKENQSLNCGTNVMKVTAVKTYVDSEDEGFMITERVLEVVQVPNQGKQNAPDIKMKLTETKPEVTKKLPANKKKQPANMAKQSIISSFFMKK